MGYCRDRCGEYRDKVELIIGGVKWFLFGVEWEVKKEVGN